MHLGRRLALTASLACWLRPSLRDSAHAWCGEPYPPFAYSLPWFELPNKIGGDTLRIVGDVTAERKRKLSPLLVLPSPGLTYEYMETLEALTVSERRVAFAQLSASAPSLSDLAAQAAAALDTLEAPRVHVLGHGLGAAVAVALQAARPGQVASLVLASPILTSIEDVESSQRASAAAGAGPLLLASTAAASGRACVDSELAALKKRRAAPAAVERALLESGLQPVGVLSADVPSADATVPVLLARGALGEVSSAAAAQRVLQRVPRARVVTFDRSGSLPFIDERSAFQAQMLQWLDEVDGVQSRRAIMGTGLNMGMPES